jgi:uncharacterized protein
MGRRPASASIAKRVPERTCVGCHQRRPQSHLLRLVGSPTGQLLVDAFGKLPGRGAYLCARRPCAEHALQGPRLREALRHEVTPCSVDELVWAMARVMEARAIAGIRMARKAGRVVSGYTQVSRALMHEPVACLLVADDTAPERRREYQGWCAQRQIPCRSFLTKARLGALAGRDESSAIGILDTRLGERLLGDLEGMSRLMAR